MTNNSFLVEVTFKEHHHYPSTLDQHTVPLAKPTWHTNTKTAVKKKKKDNMPRFFYIILTYHWGFCNVENV